MGEKKVIDVTVIDVLFFKIARFQLKVLGAEYPVSLMEGPDRVLEVAFPRAIPLGLVLNTKESLRRPVFVQDSTGVPASATAIEDAFGFPASQEDYSQLVAQLQPIAQRVFPEMWGADVVSTPTEAQSRAEAGPPTEYVFSAAPSLAAL